MEKNNSRGQILLEMIMLLGVMILLITTLIAKDYLKQKEKLNYHQVYEVYP